MDTTEVITRSVSYSKTTQTYLLMPAHMNGAGTLFGGQLLSWIDMLAGIVALRHTDAKVVTVAIDSLEFKKSAYVTDVLTMEGKVVWVGNTSLEVRVDSYRENKGGEKILINTAFLTFVSLDDKTGTPKPVPKLLLENEMDQKEWDEALKRKEVKKKMREFCS